MSHPTTSDLIFSEQANHNFSKTLGELKRSALSIRNRLESIQHDAIFAQRVAKSYGRPLIANERCGSWYIDPQVKAGSAYFKSTDGHTGVWKFSSRRLNLHLLEIVGNNDGCIIVDSTRRGKRMPDALSKTVPIWCAAINRFLFPAQPQCHDLYTAPQVVSHSEHAQISALLPNFLLALKSLNLPLADLQSHISKPLRPVWVTPESELVPTTSVFEDFHPVICCTTSRRVVGSEMSEGGYIQGAGDDTENWGRGLTPSIFWANKELLLATPEYDLPEVLERLVDEASGSVGQGMRCLKPCSQVVVSPISAASQTETSITIIMHPKTTDQSTWRTSPTRVDIGVGRHKLGSRNLRTALPSIISFISSSLSTSSSLTKDNPQKIHLACETGTDLSIGVALAILCLFCDDEGMLQARREEKVDKNFIRGRMSWISTALPDANPSRATLQSVNAFLMGRGVGVELNVSA